MEQNQILEDVCHQQLFDIVIAKNINGTLKSIKNAGFASLNAGGDNYLLKLNMFPRTVYFLAKNYSNTRKYTVFSKAIHHENDLRFQKPVGKGQILDNLKTHLQIHFLMPKMTYYMSLFPKNM